VCQGERRVVRKEIKPTEQFETIRKTNSTCITDTTDNTGMCNLGH